MNWIDQMLAQAWQSRPKGGAVPCVVGSAGQSALELHELTAQLSAVARAKLGRAEAALSVWASTGHWPRSLGHSAWYLRSYLDWARHNVGLVADTTAASPAAPADSDQRAAWLLKGFGVWSQTQLPELLLEIAEADQAVQRLVDWDC